MFEMNFSGFAVQRVITRGDQIPLYFYPNESYLNRALLWRSKINMNSFVLVVGYPRTGKSAFAIASCEKLSQLKKQEFDIEKQLTFDDIKKFFLWSKDAKDSMFILDETGTTLSPDSFWSLQQRIMRRFVQTQGFRRNILFWVLPSIVFLQKGFRFMCNYGIKTIRQGIVTVSKIQVDQLVGKGWLDWTGINIHFKLPSKPVWNKYTKLKNDWNDITLQQDIDYMDMMSKPDEIQLMRNKNLELTVKLKEQQLKKIKTMNEPKEPEKPINPNWV